MEIDLLRRREAIGGARIDELAGARMVRKITNILYEEISAFAHLFFDHECGLRGKLADRIRWAEEKRDHSTQTPAVRQLPRPGKLQIGLHSRACYAGRARRQSDAHGRGEVERAWHWADLPLDRRRHIGESRTCLTADGGEVGGQINQHLNTRRNTQ